MDCGEGSQRNGVIVELLSSKARRGFNPKRRKPLRGNLASKKTPNTFSS